MKNAKTRLCLTPRGRIQHGLAKGYAFEKYIGTRAEKLPLQQIP